VDTVDLIVENRDKILKTCAKYGAINVRVFGSCARDDYTAKSDIDILVKFKKDWHYGDLFQLQEALENILGRQVDLGTDQMLKPRVRKHVLSEAIKL